MEIKFTGAVELSAPAPAVRAFLADMRSVSACIPDSGGFAQTGDKSFRINLKVSIAMLSGTFGLDGRMVEAGPNSIAYEVSGSGAGSSIAMRISLGTTGASNGTTLSWDAVAEIHGIASGIPQDIIRGVGEEKIREMIANLKSAVEGAAQK